MYKKRVSFKFTLLFVIPLPLYAIQYLLLTKELSWQEERKTKEPFCCIHISLSPSFISSLLVHKVSWQLGSFWLHECTQEMWVTSNLEELNPNKSNRPLVERYSGPKDVHRRRERRTRKVEQRRKVQQKVQDAQLLISSCRFQEIRRRNTGPASVLWRNI